LHQFFAFNQSALAFDQVHKNVEGLRAKVDPCVTAPQGSSSTVEGVIAEGVLAAKPSFGE
jgi:hypothetical protein